MGVAAGSHPEPADNVRVDGRLEMTGSAALHGIYAGSSADHTLLVGDKP
jgi:hypothetical protein